MMSMYGHKWESSYGAEVDPDGVWQAVCGDLSSQEIRAGMGACRDQCLAWPPSAPEFRALCRPPTDWEHRRIEAADREHCERRLLEDAQKRERDEAVAFAARVGIKNLLGMR